MGKIDNDELLAGGVSGITEEDEREADVNIEPVPADQFEKLMQRQNEANYRCPECGMMSSKIGECPSCGISWTPPLYD